MDDFWRNYTADDWEKFCETMIRRHYGTNNFWAVPAEDRGDCGIEFFTVDGCVFQCYLPENADEMALYKKKIQKKINDDLKKLKLYENQIKSWLDGRLVHRWILLTPKNRTKDLIGYCKKKKNDVLKWNLAIIDSSNFEVKIETHDSYKDGCLYAKGLRLKKIEIPTVQVTQTTQEAWEGANSKFSENVERKSKLLMGESYYDFKERVIERYIQLDNFLQELRLEAPDLLDQIESSGRSLLEEMRNDSVFFSEFDKKFLSKVDSRNRERFDSYLTELAEGNVKSLPFGYIAKWVAECNMDFLK